MWVSNDGVTKNQIDFVSIDAMHSSNCLDVRGLRRTDVNTDHILVRTKTITRIATKNNKPNHKTNKNLLIIKMYENIFPEYTHMV